ncbi:cysteine desulfurase [Candidatus Kaiserbacteria bacterium]|nr:cysteine desulfurase [Candidatus Kaiserbacteria bacterium]
MLGIPRRIYLDNASATPLIPEVRVAMRGSEDTFGNPGSIHREGVAAKAALEEARKGIAHELEAKSGQIIFTSGLTESNNLAILGFARKLEMSDTELSDTHWVTTSIEHSSVLEPFSEIERRGGTVTHIEPDQRGLISAEALRNALRPNTVFVSIGWANNEIGVVQPLSELSRIIRAHPSTKPIIFHSDAGQAPLYLSPRVHTLGIDLFSLGAGKLYGPRGTGALYVADASRLAAHIVGGGQEKGLRSGTEEVVLAAGFAAALDVVSRERAEEARRLGNLRDELAASVLSRIPDAIVNGDLKHTLPHMLNVSIPNISAEYLVLALDRAGIALSTRSACNAGESRSHVVAALGGSAWRAANTLRISLGRETRARDAKRLVEALVRFVLTSGIRE